MSQIVSDPLPSRSKGAIVWLPVSKIQPKPTTKTVNVGVNVKTANQCARDSMNSFSTTLDDPASHSDMSPHIKFNASKCQTSTTPSAISPISPKDVNSPKSTISSISEHSNTSNPPLASCSPPKKRLSQCDEEEEEDEDEGGLHHHSNPKQSSSSNSTITPINITPQHKIINSASMSTIASPAIPIRLSPKKNNSQKKNFTSRNPESKEPPIVLKKTGTTRNKRRRKSFSLIENDETEVSNPPSTNKNKNKNNNNTSVHPTKKQGAGGVAVVDVSCSGGICVGITKEQHSFFKLHGIESVEKVSKTLQGCVLKGRDTLHGRDVIIKMTDKDLHRQGITIKNGVKIRVKENIIKETRLMSFLSQNDPPKEFTSIIDFFTDESFYYLIMDHGGSDLFHWVVLNHERIRNRQLSKKTWQQHVQILFSQMVNFCLFLNSLNCCHLDISLENLLIQNAHYDKSSMTLSNDVVQVKFIDFGLSELFPPNDFRCRKYVGKQHYKCPEIYRKTGIFDARKADVWSMGITLFMMLIGAPPFQKPVDSDSTFNAIYNKGKMRDVLVAWKRVKYMPDAAYDLLNRIFICEADRLTIAELSEHPYVKETLKFHSAKLSQSISEEYV